MREKYGFAVEIPQESDVLKLRTNVMKMASYVRAKDTGKILKTRHDHLTEWVDKSRGERNIFYRSDPEVLFVWLSFGAMNEDIRMKLIPRNEPDFANQTDEWDDKVLDMMNRLFGKATKSYKEKFQKWRLR